MERGNATALKLGFIGLGWIGRHRLLQRMVTEGAATVAGLCDPDDPAIAAVGALGGRTEVADSLDGLLALPLDGVVIATPSALHADQAVQCLEAGVPVFCQKPLGRQGAEVERVIAAARGADRLLDVDLSYRGLAEAQCIHQAVAAGAIGTIYAVELVFHNAYGPQSGGGCHADLGVHLIDLALWTLDWPEIARATGRRYRAGYALDPAAAVCEDYAVAELGVTDGRTIRLACSWNLHEGVHARIEATFYGTDVAEASQVAAAQQAVQAQCDRLDALVLCAGRSNHERMDAGDPDHWEHVLRVNLLGATRVYRAFNHLLPAEDARVCIVSSVAQRQPYARGGAYGASKAALRAFAETLRLERGHEGRITLVAPRLVATRFFTDAVGGYVPSPETLDIEPLAPDDVAEAVCWALTRPANVSVSVSVNVNEIVLRPRRQAF